METNDSTAQDAQAEDAESTQTEPSGEPDPKEQMRQALEAKKAKEHAGQFHWRDSPRPAASTARRAAPGSSAAIGG